MKDYEWLSIGMEKYEVHDAEENFESRTVYADSAHDAAETVARQWIKNENYYSYADYGDEFEIVTVVDGERIIVGFSVDFKPIFYTSVRR